MNPFIIKWNNIHNICHVLLSLVVYLNIKVGRYYQGTFLHISVGFFWLGQDHFNYSFSLQLKTLKPQLPYKNLVSLYRRSNLTFIYHVSIGTAIPGSFRNLAWSIDPLPRRRQKKQRYSGFILQDTSGYSLDD